MTLYSTMVCKVSAQTILERDTENMLPKVAESVSRRLSVPSHYLSSQQRVRSIGH